MISPLRTLRFAEVYDDDRGAAAVARGEHS
jgi:hypothetical protein